MKIAVLSAMGTTFADQNKISLGEGGCEHEAFFIHFFLLGGVERIIVIRLRREKFSRGGGETGGGVNLSFFFLLS